MIRCFLRWSCRREGRMPTSLYIEMVHFTDIACKVKFLWCQEWWISSAYAHFKAAYFSDEVYRSIGILQSSDGFSSQILWCSKNSQEDHKIWDVHRFESSDPEVSSTRKFCDWSHTIQSNRNSTGRKFLRSNELTIIFCLYKVEYFQIFFARVRKQLGGNDYRLHQFSFRM